MKTQDMRTPLAVLGGGPAGYVAAIRAAQLGSQVVLIEEDTLGGVCMNRGCIPTKALLRSGFVAAGIPKTDEFGVDSALGGIHWDFAVSRKNRIVKNLNTSLSQLMDARKITVLSGRGEFLTDRELLVHTEDRQIRVTFDKLILATGSAPVIPKIPGSLLPGVITSNEALDLISIPETAVIIGAGIIGLEFAAMFRSAGCKVTVLDVIDRLLPSEDLDVSAELTKVLKRQGISLKLGVSVHSIEKMAGGLSVQYTSGEKAASATGEIVLLATGRKPHSNLGLPFQMSEGAIVVDRHMETSIKGIYAAGDVIGGQLLAHLAYAEGRVAAENALGLSTTVNYNAVPSCLYTTPEYATVGLNEQSATRQEIPIRVGRSYFRTNGRAQTLGEREGFVKVIAAEDGTILGAQILGSDASELISELTLAITVGANVSLLADMVHPHPTLSEVIWEACGDVMGRSLHGI